MPEGRRLRPEEHWRPAAARDLSKYKPKPLPNKDSIKINNSPKKTPTPKASIYNLAEECGIEGDYLILL